MWGEDRSWMAKVPIFLTLHSAPRESNATEVKNGGEGNIVTVGIWQERPSSTRPPGFSLNRRHPLRWVYQLSFHKVTLSTLKAVTCFYLFHCPSPPGLGVLLQILFPCAFPLCCFQSTSLFSRLCESFQRWRRWQHSYLLQLPGKTLCKFPHLSAFSILPHQVRPLWEHCQGFSPSGRLPVPS